MKSIAKVVLVGAVAVMAIAVSAAPSEAAKKKKKGPANGTYFGQVCSAEGKVMVWGYDNKWYPGFGPACAAPFCPPAC